MLTESETRDLLAKAANTVEVAPGQPIEKTPRTIWPVLAAAAAVVAIVGTSAALVGRTSDHTGPPAVDPTTAATSPRTVLAADQIPSVFAYDADSAMRLLQSSGLRVTRKPDYRCGTTGRATKTKPAVGTRFRPGDAVTLFVTQIPPNARCVEPAAQDAAWEFLDFANGRGPAPAFAQEVTFYVDGERTGTLTAAEAADPANWGGTSAISEIREQTQVLQQANGFWATPTLSARGRGPKEGSAVPASVGDRPALRLSVDVPTDGIFHVPLTVDLYRTDGRIDTVVTVTEKPIS
jgi:PASTA domain